MNQKTRYKIAGIIFAALLAYKLYGIGKFWFIFIMENPDKALRMAGQYRTSAFWFLIIFVCALLTLIPLITLTINAFKEKINQKTKVRYMVCYAIGIFIPWAGSFDPIVLNFSPLNLLLLNFRPFISVALFAFALFYIMKEKIVVALETDSDKLKYYTELFDHGIISADEFEDMKSKIKKDKLGANASESTVNHVKTEILTQIQNKKSLGKKNLSILIGIIAVLVIALVVVFILFGKGVNIGIFENVSHEKDVIFAKVAVDGNAYIPTMDGNVIVINDEVKKAMLTKDGKTVVVMLEDGTLYFSDTNLSEKHFIADNADSFWCCRNEGFFYTDKNDMTYRVLFADDRVTELGTNIVACVAEDTVSALYCDDKGNIYTMAADTSESIKVGTYPDRVYMEEISNDGSISVWTLEDSSGNQTIILNEDDDKTTLGTVDSESDGTAVAVSCTSDQQLFVVTNYYSDKMWIKKPGEDVVTVNLGNQLNSNNVYTSEGILNDQITSKVDNIFVKVDADNGINLYCISLVGDRERVLSNVNYLSVLNGYVIYSDSDRNLYCSKIKGNSLEDSNIVASDVNTDLIDIAVERKYIYYMSDCENNSGSLYAYKIGDAEPKKVASEVACYMSSDYTYSYNEISVDGSEVYYLKDIETLANTNIDYGTLMHWNYSSGKTEKIASEVVEFSLTSGLKEGEINPKSFMFQKFNSVDKDENVFVDWFYYNGKETNKLASDITR